MITIIRDMSVVHEKVGNLLLGSRERTWNINRETILVDYPHELEQALNGCCHKQLVQHNGKIYEPLNSDNMWRVRNGERGVVIQNRPYLLAENQNLLKE